MKLFDRYIILEWSKAFILFIGVSVGILLLFDINDDLEDFLSWGVSSSDILVYFIKLIPSFLPLVFPISILISILFVLGNMHRNLEIIVMRAAGMSLFRITRGLWLMVFLVSTAMYFLNASWVPQATEQSRITRDDWKFSHQASTMSREQVGLQYNFSFDNQSEDRRWLINRYSEYQQIGYGVQVSEFDYLGRENYRLLAKSAYFDEEKESWIFAEGREVTFNSQKGEIVRSLPFRELIKNNYQETPRLMSISNKKMDDLSALDLFQLLSAPELAEAPDYQRYAVRYQSILASPLVCLIVAGFAIPFSVAGVRKSPLIAVSNSIIWFLLYYILVQICSTLGNQELLTPSFAIWLPNLLALIPSGYFFYKYR